MKPNTYSEEDYRIAKRRESQRNTRRLKAAGWYYFDGAWSHKSISSNSYHKPFTKAQALAMLDGKS